MSNPDCKAGCGFICTCGEVDFSRENELAEENVKLRAQVTRLTAQNAIATGTLECIGSNWPDSKNMANEALSRIRELDK